MTSVIQASDIEDDLVDDAGSIQAEADAMADQLVALAAFIRTNPDLAPHLKYSGATSEHNVYVLKRETIAAFATAAARAGLAVAKETTNDGAYYGITVATGGISLYVYSRRDEVCERVVTGVETVTREVPDPEALAAVPTVTVTETVETVEWVCGPLLGDKPAGADR